MKSSNFDKLIDKMSKCEKCLSLKKNNGKDCSLINIYKDKKFCKNIPSIWTDWYNRLDSNLMIIGQDWGPYSDMNKFYKAYLSNQTKNNWNNIIDSEKSLTKKMLYKFLIESSKYYNIKINDEYLNKIFITNAIMCARQGDNYRGDNIMLKNSTLNCQQFLKEQINIVNPKVIVTLGYYPILSLANIFNFKINNTLSETIKEKPIIKIDNIIIIPLYHPTAQIKKEIQLEQYKKIWQYIK